MPPIAIRLSGDEIDLSPRFFYTTTVAASPSAATETTIATLTIAANIAALSAVWLEGYAAFVVGTSGVSARLRVRQTNTSGTVVADTDAVTVTAGNKYAVGVQGEDTSPVLPGQVYVLTLTIGSGAAASTVAFTSLQAQVI